MQIFSKLSKIQRRMRPRSGSAGGWRNSVVFFTGSQVVAECSVLDRRCTDAQAYRTRG